MGTCAHCGRPLGPSSVNVAGWWYCQVGCYHAAYNAQVQAAASEANEPFRRGVATAIANIVGWLAFFGVLYAACQLITTD